MLPFSFYTDLNRSLGSPHQVYIMSTVTRFCDGMPDLSLKQREMCEADRDVMASIRYGANLAVKQCQYQFQYRRWNCSVPEKDRITLFRRITGKGGNCSLFKYFFYICYRNYCLFVLLNGQEIHELIKNVHLSIFARAQFLKELALSGYLNYVLTKVNDNFVSNSKGFV